MPLSITGMGTVLTRAQDGSIHPIYASKFTFKQEITFEDCMGYPNAGVGKLQITDTTAKDEKWTVTLDLQSIDEMDIDRMIFDNVLSSSTLVLPDGGVEKVPDTGPYEISVVGLTADQQVDITLLQDVAPGKQVLEQIASAGTVASGQYEVTSGKITFHADQAGKTVIYRYFKEQTISAIGGVNLLQPYETVEIFGKYKSTRTGIRNIWFPRCSLNNGATLDATADLSREYRATVPLDMGFNTPYVEWET